MPVRSGRSVGPFGPPKEEKGVQHIFFLCLENCFSWATWNLFDVGNQSVQTLVANNIPFGPFQCSLEGVKTRPDPFFFITSTERRDRTGTKESRLMEMDTTVDRGGH